MASEFFCSGELFCRQHPKMGRNPESLAIFWLASSSAYWQALESGCDAPPDFDINHSRNTPYHPRQIRRILARCLRGGAVSPRRIARSTLPGFVFFQVIFQFVRTCPVTGRWNTGGRRPLIRLRYDPNFIRLKLPRACQSPISRAVIDKK